MAIDAYGVTVTIKGRTANDPWIVVHGNGPDHALKMLGEAFGFEVEGVTLATASVHAHQVYGATTGIVETFKATPLPGSPPPAGKDAWDVAAGQADAPEPTPAERVEAELLAAKTVNEVKKVWGLNVELFNENPHLVELYNSRGKALAAQKS